MMPEAFYSQIIGNFQLLHCFYWVLSNLVYLSRHNNTISSIFIELLQFISKKIDTITSIYGFILLHKKTFNVKFMVG